MSRRALSCLERAEREILPLGLSLYHACRDYPGGAAAIAALYGRNPTTLQHKVSPTMPSHQVNPAELEEITIATRDPRILDSLIEAFGDAAWVDLRPVREQYGAQGQSLAGILACVGTTLRKQSGLTDTIARHLADDGRIDAGELAECKLHVAQALGALLALEYALEHDAEELANGR